MTDDEKKKLRKWHDRLEAVYMTAETFEEMKVEWIAVQKEMLAASK